MRKKQIKPQTTAVITPLRPFNNFTLPLPFYMIIVTIIITMWLSLSSLKCLQKLASRLHIVTPRKGNLTNKQVAEACEVCLRSKPVGGMS